MDHQLVQLLQKAIQEIQANELVSAQSLLMQVLRIEKKQPDALRFLGVVAALQKDWNEALRLIDLALESNPQNGIAHSNRGNILGELGRFEDALEAYQSAIALQPGYAEAYSNLGNALQALGRHEESLEHYKNAITLDPNYSDAYANQGNAYQALGRYQEALGSYERAVEVDPNCSQAFYGVSRLFLLRKQYDSALGCCIQALITKPSYQEAFSLKGQIYLQVKDYQNALAAYDELLQLNPTSCEAWISKGHIYSEMKEFAKAKDSFQKAFEIKPDTDFLLGTIIQNDLQICDWSSLDLEIKQLTDGIKDGKRVAIPYNLISLLDDRRQIRRSIEIYAQAVQGNIQRVMQEKRSSAGKIRLGYFSADFHNHPTAYLIAELFECHDKDKFELIAFVFGRNAPDEMRARLERSFDQFVDLNGMTDEEAAKLSREMQIDIAIDLKGFTKEARPKIFMYGAAPIQISYLAFPGTMGLPCFDYVIADPILIPKSSQDGFVEKVIYMPNSYQINDRNRAISPNIPQRESFGLPSNGFVFCSFNNNYKITSTVLDRWAKILSAIEGSVLWLYGDNPYAINNLLNHLQARNIAPQRVVIAGRMDSADHLARYKLADLFLDTSPCNAHTTASDALWAGLPVLTMIGESFGARVAASLLNAVGLPDLVVDSQDEYVNLAVEIANNPQKLREIKSRLEKNLHTKPLFDTPLFTRHLESAYKLAYNRHLDNLAPDHIYVD